MANRPRMDRTDHGSRAPDGPALVRRPAGRGIPLAMCPLSGLQADGAADLKQHPLKRLFDAGPKATVNPDVSASFADHLPDNVVAMADAL